jgi:transposase
MTQIASTGGIDSGKRFLDLAIYPGTAQFRVENTPEGVQVAVAWFAERHVTLVGIEASGGVERLVRDALLEAGIEVRVFDPARVRHFARAKGQRAKSDPIDAALIAEFTAAFPAIATTAHEPRREELAGLVRARRLVIAKRTDLARAVDSAPAAAKPALEAAVAQLKKAETEIDAAITERVAADKNMAKVATALVSAPGIGSVTAATLVALLPELGHVSGNKIAALVGVAPFDDDSGGRHGRRHIAGGRADARRALYRAALSASHTRGVLGAFYRRLIERGKLSKVALTACMRKLIVRLNAMIADGTTWQEVPA